MSSNKINIDVHLDDQKIPEKITWSTGESESGNDVKAFLLSLFDAQSGDTLKVDLWTKDMPVDGMHAFIYNSVRAMGRTYSRATGKQELTDHFDEFADSLKAFHDKK